MLRIFIFSLLISFSAYAQDGHHGQDHAQSHDWYRDLKQPGTGYSCCNGDTLDSHGNTREGDCRPTRAYVVGPDEMCGPYPSIREGTWCALLNGHWIPVPPRVVIDKMSPDGRNHICASRSRMIYCFLPGSPRS